MGIVVDFSTNSFIPLVVTPHFMDDRRDYRAVFFLLNMQAPHVSFCLFSTEATVSIRLGWTHRGELVNL